MSTLTAVETPIPLAADVGDDSLYEVVDGRRVEKCPMSALEGWIANWLNRLMNQSEAVTRLGFVAVEVLFLLDAGRKLKRRPDLAFVSFERWPRDRPVPMEEALDVAPDLAVEVVSRSNPAGEVVAKVGEYLKAGVRLVWVIYPMERVVYAYRAPKEVRVLGDDDALDGGDVLPGFSVPVSELFAAVGGA